jgi:hypothetical protein
MLEVAVATTPNASVCSYLLVLLAAVLWRGQEGATYLYVFTMVREERKRGYQEGKNSGRDPRPRRFNVA